MASLAPRATPVVVPGPTPGEALDPETEELWSSRALLLVLVLLIGALWMSYYMKVRRIKSIHETIVALVAGMFVGFILRVSPGQVMQSMVSFKNTILLNVLLPPVVLNAGFIIRQENFFRNFGVILAFAFAGTFISAVVLGVLVYIWALLGLEGLSLTIIECLIFGSTLSATDPVTILSIFNSLRVDPKLYSIIFGESLLNDAVAIVMYETLSQFHGERLHVLSFFHGTGIFLLVFFISMALGVIFGLGCSLLLKHSSLHRFAEIETCLVVLIAYTSYFLSNGLTMSGIVSLLFCGITLKHYAYHNMSRRTQRSSKYIFATLAQLSENFIFIYLGLSLFTSSQLVYKPLFILVTALGVCVARYCAVFPVSKIINFTLRARGQRSDELPHSYQVMLFWAGLRGAVGVALAAGLKGDNGPALRTTVLVVVVLTMIVFGGTTSRMIEIVGIRTGVEDDDVETSDEEAVMLGAGHEEPKYPMRSAALDPLEQPYSDHLRATPGVRNTPPMSARSFARSSSFASNGESDDSDGELPSVGPIDSPPQAGPSRAVWRDGQWFNVLDEQYLLPVFSNATASRRQASRKAMRKSRSQIVLESSDSLDGDLANDSTVTIGDQPYAAQPPRLGSGSRTPRGRPQSNEHLGFSQMLTQLVSGRDASERGSVPPSPGYAPDKRRGSPPRRPSGVGGGDESSGSAGSASSAGIAPPPPRLSVGQRPQRQSSDIGTLR